MLKKMKRSFRSFYMKLLVMFLLIGLLPVLLMGALIYNVYSNFLYKNMLSNFSATDALMAESVSNFITEIGAATEYIYKSGAADYDYFYELFQDDTLSETGKSAVATKALRSILYMNEAIDHVYFITPEGGVYSSMRSPELLTDRGEMQKWYEAHFQPGNRNLSMISTHATPYYRNSDRYDFTIYRNIMNTATIQTAGTEVLGTLFVDIRAEELKALLSQKSYGADHEIYMVDTSTGKYLYHPQGDYQEGNAEKDGFLTEEMKTGKSGYVKENGECLVYTPVEGTDWAIVDRVFPGTIEGAAQMIRNNTFFLMLVGTALMAVLYVVYSKRLNKPVTELKTAMNRIEKGDLEARVHIHSNDELEDIGKGMNQMAEHLSDYIQKAYVAEICQRDAELEALKTQIQPHYLYNTLDVIRMTAITNDDTVTAGMIDSLSGQLKYLIGTTGKMVRLKDELACIRNYFKLIEVRYDSRFHLSISVPEELEECLVPHLIIQPVVENAVKHGLRPKKGAGEVVVQARKSLDFLEITVMDNGVGMSPERLEEVQGLLKSKDRGLKGGDVKGMSIGVKNVSDRIRHLYGEEYGLEIDAYEHVGTIVKYWMPLNREEPPVQN